MASDFSVFDNSFFSDPFSPFSDSSSDPQHDFFQTLENNLNTNNNNINNNNSSSTIQENSVDDDSYITLEQIANALLSSTPPSDQLENLSIPQTAHNFPFEKVTDSNTNSFVPHNNSAENVAKMMQRSYSSHSFPGNPNFIFPPNLQSQVIKPPENNFSCGQIRKVCSTGDLQVNNNNNPSKNILQSSPLSAEGSFLDEAIFKAGRYTAEERKERIHRYRAKKAQRNFSKTIKYACRKTLADNRLRIRGRFARNDESAEIPKASMFNSISRYGDEDDIWIDEFNEDDSEESSSSRTFYSFGSAPYQYYSRS